MFTFCSNAKNLIFLSNVSVFWPRFVRGFEVSEMAYFVIARERIARKDIK